MISPDATGLYHPNSEQDIIDLITYANTSHYEVRVRGAAQSVAGAVYTDGYNNTSGNYINMELDQMRHISFDVPNMQVTVGAGINLGFDPYDPSGTSNEDNTNNLYYQLNQQGWAIPNVTNAIHQTVAGFISTGSAAGSMQHSFDECIVSITLIDGTGTQQTFNKSSNPDDPFYAAGLSLGLFGVITSVTLQCIASFNIIGHELVTKIADCAFDFLGPGSPTLPSFQNYLSNAEFSRTLWWPMKTLQRVVAWEAKTMTASDYNNNTGIPPNFKPQPYNPIFHKILGTRRPSEIAASSVFTMIANWPNWLQDILGHSAPENTADEQAAILFFEKISPYLVPLMADMYFPINTALKPAQQFWDYWLNSLAMDGWEYSNDLFNLSYAELWFPIDQTQNVVDTLNTYFTETGYAATGFYAFEILAAKQSQFWLSPGYMQNSMRFNIMFWNNGAQISPEDFYNQFWALFKEKNIDFRPNWGKYLPLPTSSTGPSYFQSQFPKWSDFMALRKQYDPDNIFVNTYWKNQLGI